ncbi:MAG: 3-phosphoserine/phosphohydroxythreonine transaminase [candidate division Zixibacteria bacterium]|nr:3-phosphoserine/phosphohydroxythreonine transaminase [candidate division Zixibacteria bacterium]
MSNRALNFNAGPATLPLEVLEKIKEEMLDYDGCGMSVMEMSHRSAEFDYINNQTIKLFKELLGLNDNYQILFLGGGASTQFATVPLNFLHSGKTAAYVDTGAWSSKAIKEANLIGNVDVVASSKEENFSYIPSLANLNLSSDTAYLHLTSNNTIFGTQIHDFPDTGEIPLVCDMSSDIACKKLDYNKFSLIYAGAQKNMGPAGVTIVIIRDDFLEKATDQIPIISRYKTHAEKNSLYNTPPAFAVYNVMLVLEWIKDKGGLEAIEKNNLAKKDKIYQMIDNNQDFYKGAVKQDSRSWMNVTLRLPNEDLDKKFISEAKSAGMVGLKGHRSVGGVRISTYNAQTLENIETLIQFMEDFKKNNS